MSSSSKKRDFTTSIPSPTAKKPRSQTHTRSGALVEGGIAITLKMNKMRSRQQVDIANVDLDHEQILKEQQAAYKIVDSKSILSKELADDLVPSYSNEQQGNDLILDGSKTEQTRLKKLKKGKRRTIELTAAELEKARKLKRAKERKKELYKERKQKLLKRDKLLNHILNHPHIPTVISSITPSITFSTIPTSPP
eukprot:TRINITY_DN676_c0_g1_i12.p1 TRINITY_DN676_c0_g1~~TRINITY_DN676_c0_g1_i12.p1  ORF type:complete len:195 (+),score=62.54 TRINITY_DN676_c0_g1_i12:183-767(+)